MKSTIFLFGEAEKGSFGYPLSLRSLPDLLSLLGNPPEDSLGIPYAIQALLYNRNLIYCRVRNEGFSVKDYLKGLHLIKNHETELGLDAIFIPGVGDKKIIEASENVCDLYQSILIITEKDLYDYLTASPSIENS